MILPLSFSLPPSLPSLLSLSLSPIHLLCTQPTIPWLPACFCLLATSVVQVADYYTISIASQRVDFHRISRTGSLAAFSFAMLVAGLLWYFLPPSDHGLSPGVVIGAILFIVATPMITRPSRPSQMILVGYSASGLPLYSSSSSSQRSPSSSLQWVKPALQTIMESPDTRRIFYFLLLNLVSQLPILKTV